MSSVEDSIIATQRSIITIQDELNATNDSIIALLEKDNARLTEENAMMRTKLAPYLAQEEEDRAENAIDLEQYMGYTKPRTGTFVPYTNEQTNTIARDINETKEIKR